MLLEVRRCSARAQRRLCTPTGGVETVVAVGAPSRAGGSFGAWLRPWSIYLGQVGDRVCVLAFGAFGGKFVIRPPWL